MRLLPILEKTACPELLMLANRPNHCPLRWVIKPGFTILYCINVIVTYNLPQTLQQ